MSYTKIRAPRSDVVSYHVVWFANGNPVNIVNVNYLSSQQNYSVGDKVDNWQSKIAAGASATGNYFLDAYHRHRAIPYTFNMNARNFLANTNMVTGVYQEVANGFPLTTPFDQFSHLAIDPTGPFNRAIISFRKKLHDMQNHMAGVVFVGEGREAGGMIIKPAHDVINKVDHFMKTVFRITYTKGQIYGTLSRRKSLTRLQKNRALHDLKDAVTNAYLEFVFGVKPLLSDIESAAEALARFHDKNKIVRTEIRGSASEQKAVDGEVWSELNRPSQCKSTYKWMTTLSTRFTAGIQATTTINDQNLSNLKKLYGFNWDEFVPAMWELLPWSFLIDYFSNIGQVISAGATVTSNVNWIQQTDLKTTVFNVLSQNVTPGVIGYDDVQKLVSSPGTVSTTRYTLQRTKLDTVPYPSITVNNPLGNVWQTSNIVALWLQQQAGVTRVYRDFFQRQNRK